MEKKELGAAEIIIELRNSIITVYHGVNKEKLFSKKAKSGDWKKIWKAIEGK